MVSWVPVTGRLLLQTRMPEGCGTVTVLRRRVRAFPESGFMRPRKALRAVYCHGKRVHAFPARDGRVLCSGCGKWIRWVE
jgi:hypothetical protein